MALNFPSSPSLNDTYTIGNKVYTWNGYAWALYSSNTAFSSAVISSLTAGENIGLASNGRITAAVDLSGDISTNKLTVATDISAGSFYNETANIISSAFSDSSNVYSVSDGVIHYHTANSTANADVDIYGLTNLDIGNTVTTSIILTNGDPGYYVTGVRIEGAAANVVKWLGAPPAGATTSANVDIYGVSIIKTADYTYTAFVSQSQFSS